MDEKPKLPKAEAYEPISPMLAMMVQQYFNDQTAQDDAGENARVEYMMRGRPFYPPTEQKEDTNEGPNRRAINKGLDRRAIAEAVAKAIQFKSRFRMAGRERER